MEFPAQPLHAISARRLANGEPPWPAILQGFRQPSLCPARRFTPAAWRTDGPVAADGFLAEACGSRNWEFLSPMF